MLPHEQVLSRRFVLIPLLELDFELRTPAGVRLADALAELDFDEGVRRAGPTASGCPHNPAVLLVVDVGNTQTHFGTVRGSEVVERWRFATDRSSTSDQLGAALRNLLGLRGLGFDDVNHSVLASTVPELAPEWVEMSRRYLGQEMLVVGPGVKTGMPIRTDNPRELGADRLVNALAAWTRFRRACIVVDFGTAITYDVVSADGRVPGRDHHPGHQHLARGACGPRGEGSRDRAWRAALADRQDDRRCGALGHRLRLRRSGRRDRRSAARGARRRTLR